MGSLAVWWAMPIKGLTLTDAFSSCEGVAMKGVKVTGHP